MVFEITAVSRFPDLAATQPVLVAMSASGRVVDNDIPSVPLTIPDHVLALVISGIGGNWHDSNCYCSNWTRMRCIDDSKPTDKVLIQLR